MRRAGLSPASASGISGGFSIGVSTVSYLTGSGTSSCFPMGLSGVSGVGFVSASVTCGARWAE